MLDKIISFITGLVKSYLTKDALLKFLKDKLFGIVIKNVLGTAAGGWKLFLVKTGLEQFWKNILKPFLTKLIRWFQKKYRETKYREIAKDAVEAKDESTRRKHIDDLLD